MLLRVRAARKEDAADVADIHVRSWQAAYRGLLPDEYLDGLRAEDRMQRYDFEATGPSSPSTLVATEGSIIRGFATIGSSTDPAVPDVGELLALYAPPESWGRGVGRRLVMEARTHLVERRYTEAVLWLLAGNDRAERFYRADGWSPDGRRREAVVWGVRVDEIGYRTPL
jgi:GNAT superfamily N-acetyltransferase